MKWYYLFAGLLLAVAWVQAEEESVGLQDINKSNSDEDDFDLKKALKEAVEKKCEEVGGKDLVEKVSIALDKAKACLEEHVPKNVEELKAEMKNDTSSSEELCSDKRPKLRQCFSDFVDVLKECSDEDEKYLPSFAFDALDSVLDYICADDGIILLKIFDEKTLECIMSLSEQKDLEDVCESKLDKLFKTDEADSTLTKSELCLGLSVGKTCYSDFLKQQCPDAESLREILEGFYSAISSPCNTNPKDPLNLRRRRFTLF